MNFLKIENRVNLRKERKELGLCRDCGNPSEGFVLCGPCREKRKIGTKAWRAKPETKTKIYKYKKEYKKRPGVEEHEREYQKRYMEKWKVRPETKFLINQYNKEKRKNNIQHRIRTLLRTRLRDVLKGRIKNGSAVHDLGCYVDFLKRYLESQFLFGMSWKNHGRGDGKWVIDHIVPLVSVDLTDRQQLLKACN